MDMVALGEYYPPDRVNGQSQITDYTDQPGRVLLGDGKGNFALASTQLFPVDTLRTFHVVGTGSPISTATAGLTCSRRTRGTRTPGQAPGIGYFSHARPPSRISGVRHGASAHRRVPLGSYSKQRQSVYSSISQLFNRM
jgi:hypothetical protein